MNPETRKTLNDFLVQVRNLLLLLSCPPSRVTPATKPLAWLRRASESQPFSPEAGLNSSDFFQNPQNPPRASGA